MSYYPEEFGEPAGTPFTTTSLAGLQYYDYYERDDLRGGRLRPEVGERVELIRKPDNIHDSDAIEVWFRNGQHQLGHLPYEIAAEIAPLMDQGSYFKGYVTNGGDGSAWSVWIMLCGPDVPDDLHQCTRKRTFDGLEKMLGEARAKLSPAHPNDALRDAWQADLPQLYKYDFNSRYARGIALLEAVIRDEIAGLPPRRPPSPLPEPPLPEWKGQCLGEEAEREPYSQSLRSKSAWLKAGYRVPKGAEPYARKSYRSGYFVIGSDLFGSHQVVAKRPATLDQRVRGLALSQCNRIQ